MNKKIKRTNCSYVKDLYGEFKRMDRSLEKNKQKNLTQVFHILASAAIVS